MVRSMATAAEDKAGASSPAPAERGALVGPAGAIDPTEFLRRAQGISPLLTCRICSGLFRDAHTITECLHTFCKSCLLKEFVAGKRRCPHCNTDLKPNPVAFILHDRTLQSLVDKLHPEVVEADRERETAFYEARGIKRKPEFAAATGAQTRSTAAASASANGRAPAAAAAAASASSSSSSRPDGGSAKRQRTDKAAGRSPDEEMNFRLAPLPPRADAEEALPSLGKPFLKTSATLKVAQLKKYLFKKLGLADPTDVVVLCKGAPLGPEMTLRTIKGGHWTDADGKDLQLHYCKRAT